MNETLYASFANIDDAERAMGALLDHGIKPREISLVAHEAHADRLSKYSASHDLNLDELKNHATNGITTTTAHDAETGALAGATIGLGVGVAAALASIFLPGIGLIIGGGALSIALSGAAGAAGAGAISGGVYGYLRDLGVSGSHLASYDETYKAGGAVVGIDLDGTTNRTTVEAILNKYNASNIGTFNSMVPKAPYAELG